MAIISPPAYQQGGTYSARTDRLSVITGLLGYHGNSADEASLRTRGGVRPSYQGREMQVSAQATPNMTVQVSAGISYVQNKDLANYGAYTAVNDAPVTIPIAASSGSQYRKDTIVAQVLDAETLGTVNSGALVVVQGPYAASAGATTRGTLPPNCTVLADVAVDAGVTSITSAKITDARQFQVASGGILPVVSTALPDHPAPGQVMYATDTDTFLYGKGDGSRVELPLASSSGIGTFRYAAKTANQQLTNNASLGNDAHLVVPVLANATYIVEGAIFYDGAYNQGDLKVDWAIPAGSNFMWSINGPATGGQAAYASQSTLAGGSTPLSAGTYGTGGTQTTITPRGLLTTGASAGNLQLRWAQNTAHASTLTVYQRSWIRVQRTA
jgi:hypothetical protein